MKNRSKIDKKGDQKINEFLNGFFIDFFSIWIDFGSNLGGPLGVRWGSVGALLVVLLALGANMASRPPPDPPKMASGSNF